MTAWIDTLLQGVMLGGLYALFAAGLSLIFGIMRLVNLAHGDLIVLAAFVVLVPKLLEAVAPLLPFISGPGGEGIVSVYQLQTILFGVLIVLFMALEPRGLFGLWIRVRNYFMAWPFKY